MRLNQVEQVTKKIKILKHKCNELNQVNWKIHNDLKHLQSEQYIKLFFINKKTLKKSFQH
jgi:hypothetical protein